MHGLFSYFLNLCCQLNLYMRAEVDNNGDVIHMRANSKLKKVITIKPNIQIKFGLYHYLSYDMIFKKDYTCLCLQDILKIIFKY